MNKIQQNKTILSYHNTEFKKNETVIKYVSKLVILLINFLIKTYILQ